MVNLIILCLVAFSTHIKVVSASALKSQSLCEDEWTSYKNEKCIKIVYNLKGWEDADDECKKLNDDEFGTPPGLLTIKTNEEQQFLTRFLFEENQVFNSVWLNLRKQTNGSFAWKDGSKLSFNNWAVESFSDRKLECAETKPGGDLFAAGQWSRVSCRKKNLVVCEKRPIWIREVVQNALLNLTMEHEIKEKEWKEKEEEHQMKEKEWKEKEDELKKQLELNLEELRMCKQEEAETFDNSTSIGKPSNCMELKLNGYNISGVYTIYPVKKQVSPFQVYCDMETDGGGWTVFQRRAPAKFHINFTRSWKEYQQGFGDLEGEFWLGNDFLHVLTDQDEVTLRIDLEADKGDSTYALYGVFRLGDNSTDYRLKVADFTGQTETVPRDSFSNRHNGHTFVTFDKNDNLNCAKSRKGGWWYTDCFDSNLNGLYLDGAHKSWADGINWIHWKGAYYSLKRTEMKIRPKLL